MWYSFVVCLWGEILQYLVSFEIVLPGFFSICYRGECLFLAFWFVRGYLLILCLSVLLLMVFCFYLLFLSLSLTYGLLLVCYVLCLLFEFKRVFSCGNDLMCFYIMFLFSSGDLLC